MYNQFKPSRTDAGGQGTEGEKIGIGSKPAGKEYFVIQ
jgi:hypothetical protein